MPGTMKALSLPSSLDTRPLGRVIKQYARTDDPQWLWLENTQNREVEQFLKDSNTASEQCSAPLAEFAEELYRSQLSRRELASESLHIPQEHYTYWSHIGKTDDYPAWYRHPNGHPEQIETLLDLQQLSQDHDFIELGDIALSSDENFMAWTLDTEGAEYFDLYIRRLPEGKAELLVEEMAGDVIWAEDNRTLLYTAVDATQRPNRVFALDIVTREKTLLFEEKDSEFTVSVGKTRSLAWLVVESVAKDTSESHLIPADSPLTPLQCVLPRASGLEYSLEHRPGIFYVLHNRDHRHFQIDVAAEDKPGHWHPWLVADEELTLEGLDAFDWGIVISSRDHRQAQPLLRIIELTKEVPSDTVSLKAAHSPECYLRDEDIELNETPISLNIDGSLRFHDRTLRLHEESFTTPSRSVSYNLDTTERKILKQQIVHGDLQPDDLVSWRIWATAGDGEQIPVSVIMRKDMAKSGQPHPTLLYGYGAYGEALDPWFSVQRLELLAHGVIFAVAHVRGGSERGEPWYLSGKLAHKENSFSDFLTARNALVEAGISVPERIAAYGASAGGLLVGACLNKAPGAFCAAVLDVPFLDVVRTMQNPDLPLTTSEYQEWGNPGEPEVHERLLRYSPLDNMLDHGYPPMLIQGSWHDSRVPYWEPAKWFARVNETHPDRGPVMLFTDMDAGHGGAAGRFSALKESARQDAFLIWALQFNTGKTRQ
ncbi:S9 family peptidase [Cernens ardua]|uniref:S9 family peptidase n=1 Tax=Cernens ardua TaxID=3402176 RepID=UPI003F9E74E2